MREMTPQQQARTRAGGNPGPDAKGRHPWAGIFVCHADGTCTCGPCLPDDVDPADVAVEVWEVGSHGWLGPMVCKACKASIPIVCDGEEARS